jgi:hypothetical protein
VTEPWYHVAHASADNISFHGIGGNPLLAFQLSTLSRHHTRPYLSALASEERASGRLLADDSASKRAGFRVLDLLLCRDEQGLVISSVRLGFMIK